MVAGILSLAKFPTLWDKEILEVFHALYLPVLGPCESSSGRSSTRTHAGYPCFVRGYRDMPSAMEMRLYNPSVWTEFPQDVDGCTLPMWELRLQHLRRLGQLPEDTQISLFGHDLGRSARWLEYLNQSQIQQWVSMFARSVGSHTARSWLVPDVTNPRCTRKLGYFLPRDAVGTTHLVRLKKRKLPERAVKTCLQFRLANLD